MRADFLVYKRNVPVTALHSAVLIIGILFFLPGRAQTVEWEEDVRLLNGTVIQVSQKKNVAAETSMPGSMQPVWRTKPGSR